MEAIALRLEAIAISTKKLLGAPGLTTRSKKLLGAPGIATRSKDYYYNKKLLGPRVEAVDALIQVTVPVQCG